VLYYGDALLCSIGHEIPAPLPCWIAAKHPLDDSCFAKLETERRDVVLDGGSRIQMIRLLPHTAELVNNTTFGF
jgi:hypothetical protein